MVCKTSLRILLLLEISLPVLGIHSQLPLRSQFHFSLIEAETSMHEDYRGLVSSHTFRLEFTCQIQRQQYEYDGDVIQAHGKNQRQSSRIRHLLIPCFYKIIRT